MVTIASRRPTLLLSLALSSLLVAVLVGTSHATNVACESTEFCEQTLRKDSKCVDGFCDNPFQYGCLRSLGIPGYEDYVRVCNSDDPPDASSRGICRDGDSDPSSRLEYEEIRILSQDWESAFFEIWIVQIFLTEWLGVPVTIETGRPDVNMNFYDSRSRWGKAYGFNDWAGLKRASQLDGDCSKANTNTEDADSYESCGHAVLEVWAGDETAIEELLAGEFIEPPSSVGVIGDEKWFIPKYTAEKDPSLVSYFGLKGLKNRAKLAERFLRPTTWAEYCNEVSDDGCSSGLGPARRPPESEDEGKQYFSDGLYTGHFRKTPENDCIASPTTCTGHFVDYPCDWQRYFVQQAHHLEIGLKSSGTQDHGGYTFDEAREVWHAANSTKSDVIGIWWRPEYLNQEFQGTDFEFQEISLPTPTSECLTSRISADVCTIYDLGTPEWACDIPSAPLKKIISTGLYKFVKSETSEAKQSPAYDVLKRFTIDTYELDQIFEYWFKYSKFDKNGHDVRDAVCRWVGENIEVVEKRLMPRFFPRQLLEKNSTLGTGMVIALTIAGAAVVTTLVSTVLTYLQRKKKAFVNAQIEFAFFLLFGLLLVSIAAITSALPPSNMSCVATVWLMSIGYTFELVPLILKIGAINKLLQAAKRMKRIKLSKNYLYGMVALFCGGVIVFMIIWTVLDHPKKEGQFKLMTDMETIDGDTIVTVEYSCRSSSATFEIIFVGFQALLLLCGSLLAFTTRKTKNDINETNTVAFLLYSNFVCVLLRSIRILFLLTNPNAVAGFNLLLSMVLSLDVFTAIVIYFVPKFSKVESNDSTRVSSRVSTLEMGWRNRVSRKSSVGSCEFRKTSAKSRRSMSLKSRISALFPGPPSGSGEVPQPSSTAPTLAPVVGEDRTTIVISE